MAHYGELWLKISNLKIHALLFQHAAAAEEDEDDADAEDDATIKAMLPPAEQKTLILSEITWKDDTLDYY